MSAHTPRDLRRRDTVVRELMDDPGCDPRRLAATYSRFGIVNRLVSGWGGVYRTHLAPALRTLGRPARVLDLGSGGGDVVRHLARLARADGLRVQWTGADPDDRALAAAARRADPDVSFVCATSGDLAADGASYDAVISNHVLHHLDDELDAFAVDSLVLSSGPVLHSDIARSRTAYALYAVGISPLAPGTFLRTDGLRSIRRSFTAPELQHALGSGEWTVQEPGRFRVLAVGAGRA
ncbi:methyltransferase domain-containing protein [Microbacterium koreense]|uniref:Methyltransferase domain-containing protein n=1 Tax=Microbacterium koreense TaxID=323761 RepID=A0ABW2ZN41_9MICO